MKILLAVPTFENILPECFEALYNLDRCGHDLVFKCVKGYDCAKARNVIADKAVEGCFDYVMMVDSDVIIPSDTLKLMLDPEADMVVGCCPRKNTHNKMSCLCAFKDNPPGKGFHNALTYDDLQGTERILLKGGGFACVLIRTDIFTKLKYPYFKYVVYEDHGALSEDFYFCNQVNAAGYKIYADPRVHCGHLFRGFQYE